MRQAILFDKLKLTNNPFDQNGHVSVYLHKVFFLKQRKSLIDYWFFISFIFID
ncbi:unnamed protein product [Schistosoma margrebowiei]|uniref:Uncharacterized protein n=1 Tax=Schistosoma margrebowiei TaxID=48269 RepID=A0A183MI55_9TREM|nr:unnamed protein product [Schistosoma margrebowiei]